MYNHEYGYVKYSYEYSCSTRNLYSYEYTPCRDDTMRVVRVLPSASHLYYSRTTVLHFSGKSTLVSGSPPTEVRFVFRNTPFRRQG